MLLLWTYHFLAGELILISVDLNGGCHSPHPARLWSPCLTSLTLPEALNLSGKHLSFRCFPGSNEGATFNLLVYSSFAFAINDIHYQFSCTQQDTFSQFSQMFSVTGEPIQSGRQPTGSPHPTPNAKAQHCLLWNASRKVCWCVELFSILIIWRPLYSFYRFTPNRITVDSRDIPVHRICLDWYRNKDICIPSNQGRHSNQSRAHQSFCVTFL